MKLHLVAAGLTHTEVLAALHGESFDEGWSAASFDTTLRMPGSYGFIALDDDDQSNPLGFALFRAAAGEAEVLSIATRPQARGHGVARALMTLGLDLAHDLGAKQMFLEVADDNASAIGLYRALGFRETGRRPAYYTRPEGARMDALIMAKEITAAST